MSTKELSSTEFILRPKGPKKVFSIFPLLGMKSWGAEIPFTLTARLNRYCGGTTVHVWWNQNVSPYSLLKRDIEN